MQQAFASGKGGADRDFAFAMSLAWQAMLFAVAPWHE
jgi:hypothetical protein